MYTVVVAKSVEILRFQLHQIPVAVGFKLSEVFQSIVERTEQNLNQILCTVQKFSQFSNARKNYQW